MNSAVKIDRYFFVNGVSTPELSLEGQTYFIGAEYDDIVLDAVISACAGKKKGDTFSVSLTLPAGYKGVVDSESVAECRVTVLNVYEKVTPTLSDSIAPILIPGCNSVEELKNTVRSRMEKQLIDSEMIKIKASLKEQLISSSVVKKTPVSVLNDYYEDKMTLYRRLADTLDMSLDQYAESELGMTAEELENMVVRSANERTKEALVLYSVVVAENIQVTDALLSEYADKMALDSEGIFGSGEEYMSYFGKNAVTEDYLWTRVLDIILDNAKTNS
jgi:FKBP-type peptidyl-prolyl cis-trans isomerase (trigger factor)